MNKNKIILNKSFARRKYRSISEKSLQILQNLSSKYKFSKQNFLQYSKNRKTYLEIGIGTGEHAINQMQHNQNDLFIIVDVYINGIIKFLKLSEFHSLKNFLLWTEDVDLLMEILPKDSLDGIYTLFPDPWPKNSQKKRRLFNKIRVKIIESKLREGAFLIFLSDCKEYFTYGYDLFQSIENFSIKDAGDNFSGFKDYIPTKYHKKALLKGSEIYYIYISKNGKKRKRENDN